MKKIPTVFVRDPENPKHVTRDVHSACQWVFDGEGVATRKYDGTCVGFIDGHWWARREVKPGKEAPEGFLTVDWDQNTGKHVGWEPAHASPFSKYIDEALIDALVDGDDATFELCGPKVNGNPEGFDRHFLVSHRYAEPLHPEARTFDALRDFCLSHDYEGIVFHHPDGRMAKIKRRDFAAS